MNSVRVDACVIRKKSAYQCTRHWTWLRVSTFCEIINHGRFCTVALAVWTSHLSAQISYGWGRCCFYWGTSWYIYSPNAPGWGIWILLTRLISSTASFKRVFSSSDQGPGKGNTFRKLTHENTLWRCCCFHTTPLFGLLLIALNLSFTFFAGRLIILAMTFQLCPWIATNLNKQKQPKKANSVSSIISFPF